MRRGLECAECAGCAAGQGVRRVVTAVLVNTLAVVAGSVFGLICRKGIPQRFRDAIMCAIGICTLFIGVQGALDGENVLVAIVSMVLGVSVGTLLNLDGALERLGGLAEKVGGSRFGGLSGERGGIAQGMVTAFLLWCVGAMTIVGSIQAGVAGSGEMLYTKSVLDLISSAVLASSLGVGVLLAAPLLLVWQGGLVLLAGLIEPLLTETMVNEITCVGSLAVIALGLNILGITKLKVADFLPAIVFAPFVSALFEALPL